MSLRFLDLPAFYRKAVSLVLTAALTFAGLAASNPAAAQTTPEKRIAFVVGNAAYKTGALATPANDAGLIAQTLQAAGFDVVGARDLDQNGLHDAMRDFITKVNAAGPNAVAFVYLAGYGLQYQGDNYFAPVDAQIANAADVPVETMRLSDFTKALAAINNRGSIIVLDGARANPFVANGQPLAGGLALVQPDNNQVIAFNATPGTVAPPESGPYGAYAHGLAETIRTGGLSLPDVFDRTRLRVSELTKGAEIPWDADRFRNAFLFFNRAPNAPVADVPTYDAASIRNKPIRDFDERDAYFAALYRDTLAGYEDFLAAYPDDAMARRVRAIVASRREAITWRETWLADTPQAYWSYLRRYPHGPHMWDARRRLEHLEAALEPPPSFTVIEYDVPPPAPTEIVYVDRRVLYFDDADFGYAPPPPVVFLAPPQRDFIVLPPPPPPVSLYVLPTPAYVPVPAWVEPPAYVEPPQNNIIFRNIHNTVANNTVINNNTTNITEPGATPPIAQAPATAEAQPGLPMGQKLAGAAVAAGAGAAALHVALPPSLQRKVLHLQGNTAAEPASASQTTAPGAPAPLSEKKALAPMPAATQNSHALPGTHGQPLPATTMPLRNETHAPPASPQALPDSRAGANELRKTPPPRTQDTPLPNAQQRGEANAHALPGENGKALPPIENMPAMKGENRQEPPRAVPREPAPAAQPPAREAPRQDARRPTPDIMDIPPQHKPDHSKPQPKPEPEDLGPPPKTKPHADKPHPDKPRPEEHSFAPQAVPRQAPRMKLFRQAAMRSHEPAPMHVSAPNPPKMKKCHGKHGCH